MQRYLLACAAGSLGCCRGPGHPASHGPELRYWLWHLPLQTGSYKMHTRTAGMPVRCVLQLDLSVSAAVCKAITFLSSQAVQVSIICSSSASPTSEGPPKVSQGSGKHALTPPSALAKRTSNAHVAATQTDNTEESCLKVLLSSCTSSIPSYYKPRWWHNMFSSSCHDWCCYLSHGTTIQLPGVC